MVIPTVPIHLDALLSWARVQQAEAQGADEPWAHQHDLPLERHESDSGWCFKASWIELYADVDQPIDQTHIVRRASVTEFARAWESGLLGTKVPMFDPARGLTKGASLIHQRRHYAHAIAYGVGDSDQVRELLALVRSLGKLRRRAAGWIATIDVSTGFDGYDATAGDTAPLWMRRNLPVGAPLLGYALDEGALRAPYWKRENFAPVLTPCT